MALVAVAPRASRASGSYDESNRHARPRARKAHRYEAPIAVDKGAELGASRWIHGGAPVRERA